MSVTTSFDPALHVPGMWRCAKCQFVLVQSNLNAADGSVTPRDNAGDRCPNDGSPLWRVSWKEHATEMAERCAQEIEASSKLRSRIRTVIENFRRSEQQGYRSKDRQYAIDMLGPLIEHPGA